MIEGSFPKEMRTLARVEASLKEEELSLERIGELEEKVFDSGTTEKTREIGQSLLNRLDVKRNQLIAQKKRA